MSEPNQKRVFIIAEAGVNHNGSLALAFELVDAAVEAGADAVKFQTFKAESLVTKHAEKAIYQQSKKQLDETQFDMLKRLELSHSSHRKLLEYCKKKGILFLSTAFDLESLTFLVDEIGLTTLKVSSGDLPNSPLVLAHARTGCNLIISTGMASIEEIEVALGAIAYANTSLSSTAKPSQESFAEALHLKEGRDYLQSKVTLLHCTTEYPAPLSDINLNAMTTMSELFGLKVGYSDHSEGILIPVAAVAMGAVVIEKHFTLDRCMEGPDHRSSLEPSELKEMVSSIRGVEIAKGSFNKGPSESEVKNMVVARKSLIAAAPIYKGEIFNEHNICIKRPGTGLAPINYWSVLGQSASREYKKDEIITL